MSDNVTLNSGSGGSTLWTDEVAGSKHAQVVKLADGTADSTTVIAAGGGVEASALRVTIASDSTGVVSIDDNGGSITVDGTVAATQSGTWNITNVSGTISLPTGAATQATLSALNDKVTACNTGAVVVSSSALPSGAATETTLAAIAGYLDTEVAAIVTAVQLLDNIVSGSEAQVDIVSSALPTGAATEATLAQLDGKVTACDTGSIAGSVTANAGTNLNTSALALETGGNLAASATSLAILDDWDSSDNCVVVQQSAAALDGTTRCEVKRFRVKCGTGANTLIAAVASKKFRIRSLAMFATSTTAVTVYLSTTTDTGVLGDSTDKLTFDLDGGGGPAGVVLPYNPDGWLQTSTANEALTATLSAAEEVWIIGTYLEVA